MLPPAGLKSFQWNLFSVWLGLYEFMPFIVNNSLIKIVGWWAAILLMFLQMSVNQTRQSLAPFWTSPYQKTYEGCLRQFLMKHFSLTGDPAITCFSCSPSTDTEGTEVQILFLEIVGHFYARFYNWKSKNFIFYLLQSIWISDWF